MKWIRVFQILKAKMGEEEAEAFVTYVDTTLKDDRRELLEVIRSTFATKDDLTRFATKDDLTRFASKEDLASVKGELEVRISDVKSDVIRWMFAFFVTMLIAILGLYFKK